MTKEPSKQHYDKIKSPNDQMTITRDFLAAIGFERENEGARKYKPPNVEIWNRSDFDMPVAFYIKLKEGHGGKIQLFHWCDIEKVPISDFVNDLLNRQKAGLAEYWGQTSKGD